jgi:hypothetical protein
MRLLKQQLQAFWRSLTLAAIAGLINGISTTGLIAVISGEVTQATFTAQFAGLFFGFCLLRLTTGIALSDVENFFETQAKNRVTRAK